MSEPGEGFSSRWSRRKREADVADEPAHQADSDAVEVAALTPADEDVVDPAQQVPPPDLPTIDSLTGDSDFSQFMQEGVPEELRRLALRKLWRLMPIIPDGLDDYDEDYSMIGIVAQKVSTLFKPGEGMRDPEEEPEEDKETASTEPADSPDAETAAEEAESEETDSEQEKTAEKDMDDESGDGADDTDMVDAEVDDAEVDDAEVDDAGGEIT